jgi:hypothetical protein
MEAQVVRKAGRLFDAKEKAHCAFIIEILTNCLRLASCLANGTSGKRLAIADYRRVPG